MLVFPNSKINIGLNIVAKRPDGFHNIETIFYPIPLSDTLEISSSKSNLPYQFSASGIPVNINSKDNIVVKAFTLLASKYKIPKTSIHLHKNIPFGAGLGGGSSDAAHMIKLLNEFYHLNLSLNQMEDYALQLGSDCPFFINNQAVYAEGKGEIFTKTQLDLSDYYILLIKPDIHISTPEAYSNVTPKPSKISLKELIKLPVEDWKEHIFNDFEKSIFPSHPELKKIKNELYEMGAVYATMSGSGSSMLGLFREVPVINESWKSHFTWSSKL